MTTESIKSKGQETYSTRILLSAHSTSNTVLLRYTTMFRFLGSFFFFSSRRRHTRCGRDWSSDVCSSDLPQVGAAFPAGVAINADKVGVDIAATHITGHEAQTGNTHAFEVVVVAGLPGALVLGVEVDHLDRVGQIDGVVGIVIARITAHALVGDGEVVEAGTQGEGQRGGLVTEFLARRAVVGGMVVGQIGGQVQAIAQLGGMGDTGEVALPQVFGLGGIQRGAEVVGELVGTAEVGHLVMIDSTAGEAVGIFIFGGVVHVAAVGHATGFQQQSVNRGVGDAVTEVVVGQQAGVFVSDDRVFRQVVAVAQYGVTTEVGFHCTANLGVFVRYGTVIVHRQQPCAGTAAAAVEFDACQGQHIGAQAYRAFGVAGLEVQCETGGGFLAFALSDVVTEITVEIEGAVAQGGGGPLNKAFSLSDGLSGDKSIAQRYCQSDGAPSDRSSHVTCSFR